MYHTAVDSACDPHKLSCIAADRFVSIHRNHLPLNGGQVCEYNPNETFHFVVSYNRLSSNNNLNVCFPSQTSNAPVDGCYLYMHLDRDCEVTSPVPLNLSCYYNINNCCECQTNASCSPLASATKTLPSPSALLVPGKYCYAQKFQVINFYSKPKCSIQQSTSSTTCAPADVGGAEYGVMRPTVETIILKVPRIYQTDEVYGKWVVIEDGCNTHKHYRIIAAWEEVTP